LRQGLGVAVSEGWGWILGTGRYGGRGLGRDGDTKLD